MHTVNTIPIQFKVSKNKLRKLLINWLNTWNKKVLEFRNYEVLIQVLPDEFLDFELKNNEIDLNIAIYVQFIKREGLFSIEGDTKMRIHVSSEFEIAEDFSIITKTELKGYDWLSAPNLKLGKLDFEIDALAKFIIDRLKDDVEKQIDGYVSKSLDIKSTIQKYLSSYGKNYNINKAPILFLNIQLNGLQASNFKSNEEEISWDLMINSDFKISDLPQPIAQKSDPLFQWLDILPNTTTQQVELNYSWQGIAWLLTNWLNGMEVGGKTFYLEQLDMSYNGTLNIKTKIKEPIKGSIVISGLPYIDKRDHAIHIKDMTVQVHADSIIYKLTSPILEGILLNQLEKLFPYDPAQLLGEYMSKIPSFSFYDDQIKLLNKNEGLVLDSMDLKPQNLSLFFTSKNFKIYGEM